MIYIKKKITLPVLTHSKAQDEPWYHPLKWHLGCFHGHGIVVAPRATVMPTRLSL